MPRRDKNYSNYEHPSVYSPMYPSTYHTPTDNYDRPSRSSQRSPDHARFRNVHNYTSPSMRHEDGRSYRRSRPPSPDRHYEQAETGYQYPIPSLPRYSSTTWAGYSNPTRAAYSSPPQARSRSSFRSQAGEEVLYRYDVSNGDGDPPIASARRSPYRPHSASSFRSRSSARAHLDNLFQYERPSPSFRNGEADYLFSSRSGSVPRKHSQTSLQSRSRPSSRSGHHFGLSRAPTPSPPRSPIMNRSRPPSPIPLRSRSRTASRAATPVIIVDDLSTTDSESVEYVREFVRHKVCLVMLCFDHPPLVAYNLCNIWDYSDVISSAMPIEEVIRHLAYHGCPNITHDLTYYDQTPHSRGGFGDIYQGILRGRTRVALKCLRPYIEDTENNRRELKRAARELYVWSRCRHQNVAEVLGFVEFRGQLAMVSPWMKLGAINRLKFPLLADRCRLCVQITKGLKYLHRKGIIHGDLKGANVLLSDDKVAKITDFGDAVLESSTLTFTKSLTTRWTVRWAAPEQLQERTPQSLEADIYALGMTILEVMTGQVPFAHIRKESAIIGAVLQGQTPDRPEHVIPTASRQGDNLWSLLLACWSWKPEGRPKVGHVAEVMNWIRPQGLEISR